MRNRNRKLFGGLSITLLVANAAAAQIAGSWVGEPIGTWTTGTNWSSNPLYPDNAGTATFPGQPVFNSSITLATQVTLGGLLFNGNSPWTIDSTAGTIQFAGSSPRLHADEALATSMDRTTVNIVRSRVLCSGVLTKTGSGSVVLPATAAGIDQVRIEGGTLTLSGGGNGTLTLAGGALALPGGGSVNFSRPILMGFAAATISTSAAGSATINGAISGTGDLTFAHATYAESASEHYLNGSVDHVGSTSVFSGIWLMGSTSAGPSRITASSELAIAGSFFINFAGNALSDRINDNTTVTLRGGRIHSRGADSIDPEVVSTITLAGGTNLIRGRITTADVVRQNRATTIVDVRGLQTNTAPTMVGVGSPGTPSAPVVPFMHAGADENSTERPAQPVTFDNGLIRPLTAAETAAQPDPTMAINWRVTTPIEQVQPVTVNSLWIEGGTLTGTSPILVQSGVICLSGAVGSGTQLSAPINFGTAEGMIVSRTSTTVSSAITGSNGLTIGDSDVILTGTSSYTGPTTIHGRVTVKQSVLPGVPGPLGMDSSPIELFAGTMRGPNSFTRHGFLDFGIPATGSAEFGRDLHVRGFNDEEARIRIVSSGGVGSAPLKITGNIQLDGNLRLNEGSFNPYITVTGKVSGAGQLDRAENVLLFGDNDFSGGVSFNFGTLGIGHDHALGTGTVTVGGVAISESLPSTLVSLGGPRTIDNPVIVQAGTVRIAGDWPLELRGPLIVAGTSFLDASAPLTIIGQTRARSIAFSGTANIESAQIFAESIRVFGKLKLLPDGGGHGASSGSLLIVSAGRLDITDNTIFNAGALTALRQQIITGYAGGAWNGAGISSSTAAGDLSLAIGYGPAGVLFNAFPAIVDDAWITNPSAAVVRLTLYGDANLDRAVDLADFSLLTASFGTPTAAWTTGDFDYDGNVTLDDFTLLASTFGRSLPSEPARLTVPEPGLAAGIIALVIVRARSRRPRV